MPLRRLLWLLALTAGCEKETDIINNAPASAATHATCEDLCRYVQQGNVGDCDSAKIPKDLKACTDECNNHLADGKASQSGLDCAVKLTSCDELLGNSAKGITKKCGDFW